MPSSPLIYSIVYPSFSAVPFRIFRKRKKAKVNIRPQFCRCSDIYSKDLPLKVWNTTCFVPPLPKANRRMRTCGRSLSVFYAHHIKGRSLLASFIFISLWSETGPCQSGASHRVASSFNCLFSENLGFIGGRQGSLARSQSRRSAHCYNGSITETIQRPFRAFPPKLSSVISRETLGRPHQDNSSRWKLIGLDRVKLFTSLFLFFFAILERCLPPG